MTDVHRMADRPRAKAVSSKRRRRAPREEFLEYVVAIDGWDWSYSLSLNQQKHPVDPYHEFRHLLITGKLLRPTGLKTDEVEVSLLPSVDCFSQKLTRTEFGFALSSR